MVLWIILTIGLITLAQCIDNKPGKHRYILHDKDSINLTYYSDFNHTNKEFKVSLKRGINKSETVCVLSFNFTQKIFEDNNCQVTPGVNQVTFYLQGLTANNTDIYFFQKEVMYPPPYICDYDNGTIIHVKEPDCTTEKPMVTNDTPWSPIIALGCFALYSIIITTAFFYMLQKGKSTRIQQSEYINVVPRRPRPPLSCVTYAMAPVNCHSR
ncbi:T-cell-specific surface glycoprotein CD28 [Pyxicephalus adspersus]|uniref:T-cell-specific surface glycoprotein CD28 n=1 Tax=Pyxicephalus adspersus TaxID=30357 RepID=UPI003B59FAF9